MPRSNHTKAALYTRTKRGFRAALRSDGVYELLVYEDVGANWWDGSGITAQGFKQELDRAGMYSRIALRINSPGGDAFEGVAILNMLQAQGKPIDVYVDGLAASAASIIAMAGDTIQMGSGAMMMIHNAWGCTIGNAADHQRQVNALNAIDLSIAQVYAERTGQTADACKAMMDAETWMGADQCVELGFATAKLNAPAAEQARALNLARGFQSLKRFEKVPAALKADGDDVDAAEECQCECEACQAGDCANCSNAECDDANCTDCPMQEERTEARASRRWDNERSLITELVGKACGRTRSGWADHYEPNTKEILAVRRIGNTVFNLASGPDASAKVARVKGLVAPYNSPSSDMGGFQEVYKPGCFNKWLAQDDPRVLAYHNPEKVLGRKSAGTARFWEEADGLHYEADLPDTQAGRDLRVSMERRDVRESSAAFYLLDYTWEVRAGIRTRVINEARFVEASPYSFPSYQDSTAQPAEEEIAQASAADHELELYRARHEQLMLA